MKHEVKGCTTCPFVERRIMKLRNAPHVKPYPINVCGKDPNRRHPLAADWKCIPPGCPMRDKVAYFLWSV